MPITFGSLFAGIGGFDLGFERAEMVCKWQVEIDKTCQSVLSRHWPSVRRHSDIGTFGECEAVDVICGGFPCQDLSVAGNRAGLAGDRSGLFWSMLNVVERVQPQYCVWENVAGLRSSDDGRDFQRVLRGFADIGYFGAARLVDARWFGVPQRRRRYFGVFTRGDPGAEWERACQILAVKESLRRHPAESQTEGKDFAACLTSGTASGRGVNRPGRRREDDINLIHTLRAAGADASEDGTGRGTPLIAASLNSRPFADRGDDANLIPYNAGTLGCSNGRGWCDDTDRATFIPTMSPGAHPGGFNGQDVLSLVPTACMANDYSTGAYGEAVQSGTLTGSTDTTRGMPIVCQTLNASDGGASSGEHPVVPSAMGVRRLTPRECERCQGFPDDFTRWTEDGSEISDSRRYAMIGNSVVPAVAQWIGHRIVSVMGSVD